MALLKRQQKQYGLAGRQREGGEGGGQQWWVFINGFINGQTADPPHASQPAEGQTCQYGCQRADLSSKKHSVQDSSRVPSVQCETIVPATGVCSRQLGA